MGIREWLGFGEKPIVPEITDKGHLIRELAADHNARISELLAYDLVPDTTDLRIKDIFGKKHELPQWPTILRSITRDDIQVAMTLQRPGLLLSPSGMKLREICEKVTSSHHSDTKARSRQIKVSEVMDDYLAANEMDRDPSKRDHTMSPLVTFNPINVSRDAADAEERGAFYHPSISLVRDGKTKAQLLDHDLYGFGGWEVLIAETAPEVRPFRGSAMDAFYQVQSEGFSLPSLEAIMMLHMQGVYQSTPFDQERYAIVDGYQNHRERSRNDLLTARFQVEGEGGKIQFNRKSGPESRDLGLRRVLRLRQRD